jgi:hypothetical protein
MNVNRIKHILVPTLNDMASYKQYGDAQRTVAKVIKLHSKDAIASNVPIKLTAL